MKVVLLLFFLLSGLLAQKPPKNDQMQCNVPNCVQCSQPNRCQTCAPGYTLDSNFNCIHYKVANCTLEQFECGDGSCRPSGVVCNGFEDCSDGSDEGEDFCMECMTISGYATATKCNGIQECHGAIDEINCEICRGGSVMCVSEPSCVLPSHYCDGFYDCSDKSDELNCKCSEDEFTCENGSCIDSKYVCDGVADCAGMQDEEEAMCRARCGEGMYQCNGGRCINTTRVCDGVVDCRMGEDESSDFCAHVGVCKEEKHFKCNRTGQCIFKEWRCDGQKDCPDGEDEEDCEKYKCKMNQFKCSNDNTCVDEEKRCDGNGDCEDFSDELGCSKEDEWANHVFLQKSRYWDVVLVQRGKQFYYLCVDSLYSKHVCNHMALSPSPSNVDLNKLSRNKIAKINDSLNYFGSKYISREIIISDKCSKGVAFLNCSMRQSCEAKSLTSKVFKERSSWPELVLMSNSTNSTPCGATWINYGILLTSLDCLRKANISKTNVIFSGPYGIAFMHEHKKFDPITKQNDLAYIYANFRGLSSKNIFCVTRTASHLPYVSCYTMAEIDPADGVNPKHVATVRVDLLSQKECIQAVNRTRKWTYFPVLHHIDYEDFICVQYHNQNIGNKICQASSGYPLVCTRADGVMEQVGTSVHHPANTGCGVGVFTNLVKKLDFIN